MMRRRRRNSSRKLPPLNSVAIAFGSYPVRDQPGEVKAVITLEADGGEDGLAQLDGGVNALLASLPDGAVVEVSESLEIGGRD